MSVKKTEQSLQELLDNIKLYNSNVIRLSQEESEARAEGILISTKNI